MTVDFDPALLSAAYDHARLVPFIGSGMSVPACRDWANFVNWLEVEADINPGGPVANFVQRASCAVQQLRLGSTNTKATAAQAIEKAVYDDNNSAVPPQAKALANVSWPLVCTTNYDEIYLRAKGEVYRHAELSWQLRTPAGCTTTHWD